EKTLIDEFGGFIIISSEENDGNGLLLKPVIQPEENECGSCMGCN
ncbi:MAG TPA: HesB-like protein, partial [Clostridium sp.]